MPTSTPSPAALRYRDAAAVAAFAAAAVSRELPVWLCILFGLLAPVALVGRRPLAIAPTASLFVVLLAGGALYVPVFLSEGDLVVAACGFAALLLLQRLLCPPIEGTTGQIQLLGLLLVAGGAALSGELWFALCLLVYGGLTFLSLGHGLLRNVSPAERTAASRRLLGGAGLAAVGAIALFLLFPRLSWNVAAQRLPKSWSRAETGLSDRIRLQTGGAVKTNPRVVFRSRLKPDPKVDLLDRYWVAHQFTHFNGRDWYGEPSSKRSAWEVELETPPPRRVGEILQETEVTAAMGSATLPLLEAPVWVGRARVVDHRDSRGDRPLTLSELREGTTAEVRVVSLPPGIGFEFEARSRESTRAPAEAPDGPRDENLQLPDGLDGRVSALARQLAGDARDPLTAADRIARYLRSELRYSLEPSDVPPTDPLADFLFVRREGHCEHFATALAVMLRSLGIEARVATGFYGGIRTASGRYQIRAGDAHAWTQVFTPDRGFVTVDATPESFRSASPTSWKDLWVSRYEQLLELWRSRVLDYSFRDQAEWAGRWNRSPQPTEPRGEGWNRGRRRFKTFAVIGGLIALVAGAAWRLRITASRDGGRRRDRHLATVAWRKVERRVVKRLGPEATPRTDETSTEWLARVTAAVPTLAVTLGSIERRYREARFGHRPLPPEEASSWVRQLR